MKKTGTKKSISAMCIFFAVILLLSLSSCGAGEVGGSTNENDGAMDITTASPLKGETGLPDADTPPKNYGGLSYNILITDNERLALFDREDSPSIAYFYDDAKFSLLLKSSDISLSFIETGSLTETVQEYVTAGESDIAMAVLTVGGEYIPLAVKNLLVGGDEMKGMRLSAPYYQMSGETLKVKGKISAVFGDLIAGTKASTYVLSYHPELFSSDFAPETMVKEGKWTLDALSTALKEAAGGIAYKDGSMVEMFYSMGAGITEEADGKLKVNGDREENKTVLFSLLDKLHPMHSEGDTAVIQMKLSSYPEYRERGYKLLPLPKSGESGSYVSPVDYSTATCVSFISSGFREEYSEIADMFFRYSQRDAFASCVGADGEMLDMILSSRVSDLLSAFGYTDIIGSALEDIERGKLKRDDFSSYMQQRSIVAETALSILYGD